MTEDTGMLFPDPFSGPTPSIDDLRREARRLHKSYEAGDRAARERLRDAPPRGDDRLLKRADFLQVVARERGFESWPKLKLAAETQGLDRAARIQRLKIALYHGQMPVVERLLAETPDLAEGHFGLKCALCDLPSVEAALAGRPDLATARFGPRSALLHLAFSRWQTRQPEAKAAALQIARLLVAQGADVNDAEEVPGGARHSALYGALCHGRNIELAGWLLEQGASANDGESLYHSVEPGGGEGLALLLDHGADPRGTNALLRALDFHDHGAVQLLLAHGADPNDTAAPIPALHHGARRGCDRRMIDLLLEAGADPAREWRWSTPYAYARVMGCAPLAEALEARGLQRPLSREEALMAEAAQGRTTPGAFIDPAALPPAYDGLMRDLADRPERLGQIKALVALGLPYDAPDALDGVPPVQAAAWGGHPELLGYFLSLRPDLGHVNHHGGTLLGALLHGADHAPEGPGRDHLACLTLLLDHGVALPRKALAMVGRSDLAAALAAWAEAHPGQLV
ncbi:ankyrin repeat domain-containing protein [Salipiger sp. CCB-MM3]|uniref:ankyrin repeat domain-containing protein n=1 Tax=Salipiger sp. CCB-MM3 TaxID=1792508 RepID=UPI001F481D68|nr:ankyrin repeat domain-containing protein [Salipiger sp. CCB-MM3]